MLDRRRRGLGCQQLELRLHAGDRGAQLMGGVGDELPLRLHRGAQHLEQAVERDHHGRDFPRHERFVDRAQIECGAAPDLLAQFLDGPQTELNPDPDQHQRQVELHEIPQQRAHETEARGRLMGGAHVRGRQEEYARGRVEARGQRAHVATIEAGEREHLIARVGDRHGGQLRVAQQQPALRVAHGVGNRIGRAGAAACHRRRCRA